MDPHTWRVNVCVLPSITLVLQVVWHVTLSVISVPMGPSNALYVVQLGIDYLTHTVYQNAQLDMLQTQWRESAYMILHL